MKFLIEGEEESGGEHIARFVASGEARLKADAAVICDTEMFAPELPTSVSDCAVSSTANQSRAPRRTSTPGYTEVLRRTRSWRSQRF